MVKKVLAMLAIEMLMLYYNINNPGRSVYRKVKDPVWSWYNKLCKNVDVMNRSIENIKK